MNTQSYAIIRVGAVGRVIGVDFCIHAGTRGGVATLLHKGMVTDQTDQRGPHATHMIASELPTTAHPW